MEAKMCEYCGEAYLPKYRVSKKYWDKRRFCSDPCKAKALAPPSRMGRPIPLLERFWKKVHVCEHGLTCRECCWLWIGTKDACGYGMMYKTQHPKVSWYKSNRLAYELFIGPIPESLHVLHNCPQGDNPACVNYNGHLWVGTPADNAADRDAKGRQADRRGMKNGRVILSDADVAAMRRLYALGRNGKMRYGQARLAQMFGCSEAQARRIVLYKQRV